MSDLWSKLERPAQSDGMRARATFEQLDNMWGELHVHGDEAEFISMGHRSHWRRVSGSGKSAVWEKENPQPFADGSGPKHRH
jgi:hypothetical protein